MKYSMWTKIDNNTTIDLAEQYYRLMKDEGINRKELSLKVGISYDKVKALMSLLKLDEEILNGIKFGLISVYHGKQLLRIEETDKRKILYSFTITQNYSARDLKKLIDIILKRKKEQMKKNYSTYVFNGKIKCRTNNKIIDNSNEINNIELPTDEKK